MRTATNKLLEMMNRGLISPQAVAEMALAYISEDDVKDMMLANEIDTYDFDLEAGEDFADGQPDEAQEWYSYDPDC